MTASDWSEIKAWRRETRQRLIALRVAKSRAEREETRDVVSRLVREQVPGLTRARIGFYWPFKGEIDLRGLLRELIAAGAEAALPAVVERARPVEFRAWRPGTAMERGIWDIPVPAPGTPVRPTLLLVPLVGFDDAGYRLGHGGGYYDRTLATLAPKPLTIGVGYAATRLETIHPQPHDIPMDAIVTEDGVTWHERARAALGRIEGADGEDEGYASPACAMHEMDASYMGLLDGGEVLALLGELLEAERAGARGVAEMSHDPALAGRRDLLASIARDEARFCAMLSRHIVRLGGTPSRATGAFYGKLAAVPDPQARIDLLNRGQGWVVRKLREAAPKIRDEALAADLRGMLADHERNIARLSAGSPGA